MYTEIQRERPDGGNILTHPDYIDGNPDLIKPKKLLNPVKASKSHQELHRELLMNHKRYGDLAACHWSSPRGAELSELRSWGTGASDRLEQHDKSPHLHTNTVSCPLLLYPFLFSLMWPFLKKKKAGQKSPCSAILKDWLALFRVTSTGRFKASLQPLFGVPWRFSVFFYLHHWSAKSPAMYSIPVQGQSRGRKRGRLDAAIESWGSSGVRSSVQGYSPTP